MSYLSIYVCHPTLFLSSSSLTIGAHQFYPNLRCIVLPPGKAHLIPPPPLILLPWICSALVFIDFNFKLTLGKAAI
ncbi:hypothetical protein Hdeb2414_s0022g00611861 [Helianthus debilis subsp. tardiflorus]